MPDDGQDGAADGLAADNWAALLVVVAAPAVGLIFRITVEEQALLAALGESYRRFAAGRPRLIPGIW